MFEFRFRKDACGPMIQTLTVGERGIVDGVPAIVTINKAKVKRIRLLTGETVNLTPRMGDGRSYPRSNGLRNERQVVGS